MNNHTNLFEKRTRVNGEEFYCLTDKADKDRPDVKELIKATHESLGAFPWPEDWIYDQIYWAFHAFEDRGYFDDEDDYHRFLGELEPEYVNCKLLDWAKHGWAEIFIQDQLDEMEGTITFFNIILQAQLRAITLIYDKTYQFLLEQKEEIKHDS